VSRACQITLLGAGPATHQMLAQLSQGMNKFGALHTQHLVRRTALPACSTVLWRAHSAFRTQVTLTQAQRLSVLQAPRQFDLERLERLAEDPALNGPLVELKQALERQGATMGGSVSATPPDTANLTLWALLHGTPYVAFGFMDNALMLLAGDYIDSTWGVSLGVSTMVACGIGNIIGDVCGIFAASPVEVGMSAVAAALRLPMPKLSEGQKCLPIARMYKTMGCVVGVISGCLLGMFPLVWPTEMRLWDSKNTLCRNSE